MTHTDHRKPRRSKRRMPAAQRDREARIAIIVVVGTAIGLIAIAQAGRGSDSGAASAAQVESLSGADSELADSSISIAPPSDASAPADPAAATASTDSLPDLDVVDEATSAELSSAEVASDGSCLMTVLSLRHGESGESVSCLQGALAAAGYFTGTVSGQFDQATYDAVKKVQEERNLYVDGVVGRETAISLEIWPEEESFVTRTPPPAAGAMDAWGYPLSSVASTGDGAPPVPANSGSGRRVVYERAGQRVWAIDKDENIIRSWLVSGSQYSNEVPGTHRVYSKSEVSTAWNGKALLPLMVRWYQTDIGHLGFHAIPLLRTDNSPYQTEAELGTRLSGGCQRQANRDAQFMWDFAEIGTTVVVL